VIKTEEGRAEEVAESKEKKKKNPSRGDSTG
jgi:hypothetical protein